MRWWSVLSAVLFAFTSVTGNEESTNAQAPPVTTVIRRPPSGKLKVDARACMLGPVAVTLAVQEVVTKVAIMAGLNITLPVHEPSRTPDDSSCWMPRLQDIKNSERKKDPFSILGIVSIGVDEMTTGARHELPLSVILEQYYIHEFEDIVPAYRRACLATKTSQARSILDLADPSIAAPYHVPYEEIQHFMETCNETDCYLNWIPDWCRNQTCATILTSRKGEADVFFRVVKENKLYASIVPFEDNLPNVTTELAARPIVACDWAPELFLHDFVHEATVLGPPPCWDRLDLWCPFEMRRTMLYENIGYMAAYSPSVHRALRTLKISEIDMPKFIKDAMTKGPKEAADIYIKDHKPTIGDVIYAFVQIPLSNDREAYDNNALAYASILAEEDIRESTNFKVTISDDKCHSIQGSESLINSQTATDQISLVVGSACGAVWNDDANVVGSYKMPMLAYTLQAPLPKLPEAGPFQMLAAGDAREAVSALAELVKTFGWHRVAALYEPATKPLLSAIDKDILFSIEVFDNGTSVGHKYIYDWASKAYEKNARILYLCVEDTRIARAAMCAARSYGLTPKSGTVLLLCNTHQHGWLKARPGETCTTEQLQEEAEGHFSVIPDWVLAWNNSIANSTINSTANMTDLEKWMQQLRFKCYQYKEFQAGKDSCSDLTDPDPYAGLLYDMLRSWAESLSRLLNIRPYAAFDIRSLKHVSFLVNDTIRSEYKGLTGTIKWKVTNNAYAREVSFNILQWDSHGGAKTIGTWNNDSLKIDKKAIRWLTSDGKVPDDGEDKCALEGLAKALNTDCRIAFVALCSSLVAILGAIITAVAWHCKRRAEKEYRKRLQLLGMRPLAIKPVGLDRWEVPRERVVINRKLGTGAFGTVYGGHALLSEERGWSAVAVKTLKAGATTEEKLDFLSEAEAMKRFDHKNVVRLLGVVTKTEPVCTVMEFMLYGDLKNYLLARRHLAMGGGLEESEGLEADEASPRRLTGMALDVARALSYLAQLRYVHRDVAARNCLISARRVVKIADFGMTRLVFENDYYRFSRKGMLPVRWMAPESLALGVFSPASDVWSFGVLLYEIVTFGSLPYQGLSNSEVLTKVKSGRTLDLPQGLRPQLDGLIKSCWHQDPKIRPTASEVAAFLADAPRLLTPCVDVPIDAMSLDGGPPWRLPRDQAEARWVSWASPPSATTDTTYLSTEGAVPLDTDSFLP